MTTSNNASSVDVTVSVMLHSAGEGDTRPALAAYAFSQGGKFLARQGLDGEAHATLKVPGISGATAIRVMVAPDHADTRGELADLVRIGAVEQHLRVAPEQNDLVLNYSILPIVWRPWLEGRCCIGGTLVKNFAGYSNAVSLPVCGAIVEIYEVMPWRLIIPLIPVKILGPLRQAVASGVAPIHGPDPGPLAQQLVTAGPVKFDALKTGKSVQPSVDYGALKSIALAGNDVTFKAALLDQEALIRPLLCYLWPEFTLSYLVGTATTDQCGSFQFCFFKGFCNPGPTNLYFKAKVRVPGTVNSFTYIYAPEPVGCHTWWNLPCGSQVQLVTTSEAAIACPPCSPVVAAGDNWVMFTAIGNTSLASINGTGQALIPTTTAANLGLISGAPWGGTLLPRLDFDDSLFGLGVQYYQVSWRRAGGQFTPINQGDIYRHYIYNAANNLPAISPYLLGPQTVGNTSNLFEIPPVVPPQGQWVIVDAVEDTASAQFPTDIAGVAPGIIYPSGVATGTDQSGLFEIQISLFDAGGDPVDIAALGIKYVIPTSTDLTQTILTADASTITQPGGGTLVQGNNLVVSLYLNNNRCYATINAPTINANAADDCCGVLDYAAGDQVDLSWTALQVGNFATFNFDLYRGAYEVYADDGQAVTGGSFSSLQSVGTLMGPNASCSETCTLAGFSQNLGVYALATDGWSVLTGYNSYAVWAFVLAEE